jgi:hypothetical protein
MTNVILHCLNTGFIFLLGILVAAGKRRLNSDGGSGSANGWIVVAAMATASMLYAIHPLRVESVAWVSDRKDLLCVFFLVPSVLFYVLSLGTQEHRKGTAFLICSFVFFVFGLLSKPVAVGLPVVLLALDWYLLPEAEWRARWKALVSGKAWYFAASLAIVVVMLLIPSGGKRAYAVEQLDGFEAVLFPLYSLGFYLWKTLVPVGLSPIYPAVGVGGLLAGAVIVCAITVGTVLMAMRGQKASLLCWIAYVAFLVPTVVGFSSGMQPLADRFSYLPTIGLFLSLGGILVVSVTKVRRVGRIAIAAASFILVAGLVSTSMAYSSRWQSSATLWQYVHDNFPAQPDYIDAYVNLGAVYAHRMELPEAEKVLREATQMDPRNADAFYNLAHVLYLQGEWEDAVRYFRNAMESDTTYVLAYFNYAIVTSQLGRDSLAIPAMRHAARLGLTEAIDALRQSGIPLTDTAGTSTPE